MLVFAKTVIEVRSAAAFIALLFFRAQRVAYLIAHNKEHVVIRLDIHLCSVCVCLYKVFESKNGGKKSCARHKTIPRAVFNYRILHQL